MKQSNGQETTDHAIGILPLPPAGAGCPTKNRPRPVFLLGSVKGNGVCAQADR